MSSLRLLFLPVMALCLMPYRSATAAIDGSSCHKRAVVLQLRDARALVTPMIDGHKTPMILDTGASETVLFRDAPDRLGLPPSPNLAAAQTTSYGQPLSIHFVHAQAVEFAGTVSRRVDLAVLPTMQGDGILSGFFADPRLQEAAFDLAKGKLYLACPPYIAPRWARRGPVTTVPLEKVSRVFGAGSVRGVAMRVLFDTGSPTSSMTLVAARRAGIAVDGASDSTASGLAPGSALRAWSANVDAVRLGDGDAADMPMQIVDKPHANADIIIGFDFFARHRVWMDRSQHVLRFTGLTKSGKEH
jgi:predicted aspartyl protease